MKHTNFFADLLISFALLSSGALRAQEHQHEKHEQESKAGHSHSKAETHGGEVAMTTAHHFEVVWMPDHVMVYLYDMNQKPLAAKGVTGEVEFEFKGSKEKQEAALTLMEAGKMMAEHPGGKMEEHPSGEKHAEHPGEQHETMHGKMSKEEMEAMHKLMSNQDHLVAHVDLGEAKEGEVKATFTLTGLTGEGKSEVTFTSKYKKMSMMHHETRDHEKHEQHH